MPATAPRDSTLAVVGDGFGSLIVYATAIYLGYRPEEISIFGTNDNPVGTYQQFAHNLGQTVLRSESESHFLPADWPTFAQLDAWSRREPGAAVPLDQAQVQPRRAGHPGRGRRRPAPPRLGDVAGFQARRLAAARGRAAQALRPLRRGRELHRPLQARDDGARPRAAAVPARARQGEGGGPARSTPASSRPTRPSSTTRRAATSSSAPASRRSTSGPTRSTPAPR